MLVFTNIQFFFKFLETTKFIIQKKKKEKFEQESL